MILPACIHIVFLRVFPDRLHLKLFRSSSGQTHYAVLSVVTRGQKSQMRIGGLRLKLVHSYQVVLRSVLVLMR